MLRALVVLSLIAVPAVAQDAPHIGTWKVTFPAGAKVENGAVTQIIGTGVLTVEKVSDSLVGTLAVDPIPDLPPRPNSRLVARATSDAEVTFTSTANGTIVTNSGEQQITAVSTWKLKVSGDSLTGTVERKVPGVAMAMAGPQPVSGVRAR